ncbi:MAG: hypothetical protein MUE81_10395 [Thermoflexibacter sp.]|jgi:hypothetical protein|nr:hypothetical protein [Thermoflexibacter sp.]
MLKIGFSLTLFLLGSLAFAQSTKLVKEFALPANTSHNYQLINLKSKGFVSYIAQPSSVSEQKILLAKYDTTLQKKWENSFSLQADDYIKLSSQYQQWVYFLIYKGNNHYALAKLDTENGLITFIKYEKTIDIAVSHFVAYKNVLLLGGIANGIPMVIYDDYEQGTYKVLPFNYIEKEQIEHLSVNATDQSIFVVLAPNQYDRRKKGVRCFVFDDLGNKVSEMKIDNEPNRYPYTFQTYVKNKNEQYLIGLYSYNSQNEAQGIYAMRFVNSQLASKVFHDFSAIKSISQYLKEGKQEKILEKIEKTKQKGKTYPHDYLMVDNALQLDGDKLIYIANAYKIALAVPQTQSNKLDPVASAANWSQGSGGGMVVANNSLLHGDGNIPQPNYYPIATGKNKTHAMAYHYTYQFDYGLVCAFDQSGNLIADNYIRYNNLLKDNELSNPLLLYSNKDNEMPSMSYLNDHKLYQKQGNSPTALIQTQELPLLSDRFDIANDENRNIRAIKWYDNHILISGVYAPVNAESGKEVDKIFFLMKISNKIK